MSSFPNTTVYHRSSDLREFVPISLRLVNVKGTSQESVFNIIHLCSADAWYQQSFKKFGIINAWHQENSRANCCNLIKSSWAISAPSILLNIITMAHVLHFKFFCGCRLAGKRTRRKGESNVDYGDSPHCSNSWYCFFGPYFIHHSTKKQERKNNFALNGTCTSPHNPTYSRCPYGLRRPPTAPFICIDNIVIKRPSRCYGHKSISEDYSLNR